ncbi:MAG: CoA activase, partial [Chloroflexi bacterium]|nr:CoA activase [Chloroflexota bacterium]
MITAGVDVGAKTVKVILLEDGQVMARAAMPSGFDAAVSASQALKQALEQAAVEKSAVVHVTATGVGHEDVAEATSHVSDVAAAARGSVGVMPQARTVLDVGAEEGRAIRCDRAGKVVDFAMNEKCAAGAGTFVESMARALEMPIEAMGDLSLQSRQAVPMNAQCAVFAESEVVSLIHARTPREDIVRAVHEAMADRIISMARRVGIEDEVVLIGGVGRNIG